MLALVDENREINFKTRNKMIIIKILLAVLLVIYVARIMDRFGWNDLQNELQNHTNTCSKNEEIKTEWNFKWQYLLSQNEFQKLYLEHVGNVAVVFRSDQWNECTIGGYYKNSERMHFQVKTKRKT